MCGALRALEGAVADLSTPLRQKGSDCRQIRMRECQKLGFSFITPPLHQNLRRSVATYIYLTWLAKCQPASGRAQTAYLQQALEMDMS